MRAAITGGTGFVGRHLGNALAERGREVVRIARGLDRWPSACAIPNARFFSADLSNVDDLVQALGACGAVAHCAGINREVGKQTYDRIRVTGTRNLVEAARRAGVGKFAMLGFLRARPDCGSGYHESRWAAEEIVRASGIRPPDLQGGSDLRSRRSHARSHQPCVAYISRVCSPRVSGPAGPAAGRRGLVSRLGRVAHRGPPVETDCGRHGIRATESWRRRPARWARDRQRAVLLSSTDRISPSLADALEKIMKTPHVSPAQVRIFSEGIVEASPPCARLPEDLLPPASFSFEQIRRGLPEPERFGIKDLRCSA